MQPIKELTDEEMFKYFDFYENGVLHLEIKEVKGTLPDTVKLPSHVIGKQLYLPTYGNYLFKKQPCTYIDLSNIINISNISTMFYMFYDCLLLEKVVFGSVFRTCNLYFNDEYSVSGLFSGCEALTEVDLENLGTLCSPNAKNFSNMFCNCKSLKSINLDSVDTKWVTDMQGMFWNCNSLESLDISHFDLSGLENVEGMFYNCKSIKNVKLPNFIKSKLYEDDYLKIVNSDDDLRVNRYPFNGISMNLKRELQKQLKERKNSKNDMIQSIKF